MVRVLYVIILLATVLCQEAAAGIFEDLLHPSFIGNVSSIRCSKKQVLLSKLTFTLYTRKNPNKGITLNSTNLNQVSTNKRTIFIIHGWLESNLTGWVNKMKDVYLNSTPANIIVVDWSNYDGIDYFAVLCYVPLIGRFVGDLIYNLTLTPGISLNKTQIVGFSAGAQISGIAGQEVQNKTGAKIKRIIGLEAAGPGYEHKSPDERLDANDAAFVLAVHTSEFGCKIRYGTVDFKLNYFPLLGCGIHQPGCPLLSATSATNHNTITSQVESRLFCSHLRAVAYFIESITSLDFIGVNCQKCGLFGADGCKFNKTTIMGEHCPSTARGEIMLNTNFAAPYAKGEAGIPRTINF